MNNYTPASPPYPMVFPSSVQDALYEMSNNSRAPDSLVAMAFLATMSASLQGIFDVCTPIGNVSPVSINGLTIADSGERKSFVYGRVASVISTFDADHARKYTAAVEDYKVKIRTWRAVENGYLSKIRKFVEKGKPVDDLEQEMQAHASVRPLRPRLRKMLRDNISAKALMEALGGDGESIAFLSSEGGIFIKGGALDQVELLNECWSGARSLSVDRANGENLVIRNPRVTIAYMVQEAVLNEYLQRRGTVAHGSGHWARYLIAKPVSTQGTRFIYSTDQVWKELQKFHARVRRLLDEYARRIESGEMNRTVLYFSADAKVRWRDASNWIEGQLRPCAYLSDIRDFSSKVMEIVARLAALLHSYRVDVDELISGEAGEIPMSTLEDAIAIAEWHLHEFKRIFAPQSLVTAAQEDAQRLEHRLYVDLWCKGYTYVRSNLVLQYGPLRDKKRRDAALDILVSLGRVWIGIGQKREKYINLNPHYFSSLGNPRL
ncbi:YfjI family protein [Burkholderia vietnamiensis]|uniref:YfjI family protein n=1 Tax=Burkholderia vietnamiensis TaxID=60552 RepID=UPI001593BED8|nr:YfjI family protein [Burkholderia vietnamiensis]